MRADMITHRTADEKMFIDDLSLPMLEAYYGAIGRRSDWAGMDRAAIVSHCNRRIESLKAMRNTMRNGSEK